MSILIFFLIFQSKSYQVMLDKDSIIYLSNNLEEVLSSKSNFIYDFLILKGEPYFTDGKNLYLKDKIIYQGENKNIFALTTDGKYFYFGVNPESIILKGEKEKIVKEYKIPASNILRLVSTKDEIYVGTSYPAIVYQLFSKKILAEINDENVSALTYFKDTLFIGTAKKGYLYCLPIKGKLKLLYDCEEEEIKDIVVKDNFLYFITNAENKLPSLYSFDRRKKELKEIFTFPCSTLYSLQIKGETLIVSGSFNILYKIIPEKNYFMIFGFDGELISKIFIYQDEVYIATSLPAKIYRLKKELAKEGIYLSPIIDLNFISQFGNLEIESELPLFTSYNLFVRSGAHSIIDETWSDFIKVRDKKMAIPDNRYFQYKIELKRDKSEKGPIIKKVRYFYRNINQPPKIKGIKIYSDSQNPKIKIIKWEATDPNSCSLLTKIYYQIKDDKNWFFLNETKESEYKLISEKFPDGYYKIKLIISDEICESKEEALRDSIISNEFLIDNTPPEILSFEKKDNKIKIKIKDSLSIIKNFLYSIDNEKEEKILPIDKIFDDKEEEFIFEVKKDKFLLNIIIADEYLNEKRYNWLIK